MVGKRSLQASGDAAYATARDIKTPDATDRRTRDIEAVLDTPYHYHARRMGRSRLPPRIMRFQDIAWTALEDARREELKKALLGSINRDALEQYRKSDDELKAIKNKNVRRFYEEQNRRLNDRLEVDAVVLSVADDVLESLAASGAKEITWSHSFAAPGTYQIACQIDHDDDLELDNTASVVIEVVQQVPVLIVEGAADLAETQQDSFFVQAALGWIADEPLEVLLLFMHCSATLQRADRGGPFMLHPGRNVIGPSMRGDVVGGVGGRTR
jgi:hypothetical protein